MPRKRSDTGGLKVTMGFVGLAFAATAFTQIDAQVLRADWIKSQGRLGKRRSTALKADTARGTIFTADGKVLAQSEDVYELGLFYDNLPKSMGFYSELSRASGIPEPELREPSLTGAKKRIWRTQMAPESAARVKEVQKAWAADGVSIARALARSYPLSEAASGVTGSVREGTVFSGLEKGIDPFLMGEGEFERAIAGLGDAEKEKVAGVVDQGDEGRAAVLTINSELQVVAAEAVRRGVEENDAERGCAVILDPHTGDICALANWPSYDPAKSAPKGSDFNASIMSTLEPGSTFKLLTLAKALTDKKITLTEKFASTSALYVQNGISVHNHDGHAYGSINAEKAIAVSCNVTAARWALKIGRKSYIDMIDKSGMLEPPQLGLPGSRTGLFNRNDYTQQLQLANLGFGQAINLTPVRLASLMGMIANGGELMEPRLVKSAGGVELKPVSRGQILNAQACNDVLAISEKVISDRDGTGHKLVVPGLRVGGKTGTAQKTGKDGKIGSGGHVANFVGFVPVDHPKYVVLIMIDNPKGKSYYGGSVSGPVFVDIAKSMLSLGYVRPSSSSAERYNKKDEGDARRPN
jgi:cell division protein FtsI/penicillin-binding protein 2